MNRVSCAQLDVVYNDPVANADRAVDVLAQCHQDGADLVVFPEAFLTGYCVSSAEEARAIALSWDSLDGGDSASAPQAVRTLGRACRDLGIHVIVGFAQEAHGALYNSAVLIEPTGKTSLYQKTHLPCLGFDRFATAGSRLDVFDTALGRIGILICFDLRIPEAARTLTLKGAELIVLPTNWPEQAEAGPNFIAAARAAENRVFLATCNRVGVENGFKFVGMSGLYGVRGETLEKAGGEERVLTADLDLAAARSKTTVVMPGEYEIDVVGTRQPSLYQEICRPR